MMALHHRVSWDFRKQIVVLHNIICLGFASQSRCFPSFRRLHPFFGFVAALPFRAINFYRRWRSLGSTTSGSTTQCLLLHTVKFSAGVFQLKKAYPKVCLVSTGLWSTRTFKVEETETWYFITDLLLLVLEGVLNRDGHRGAVRGHAAKFLVAV